MEIRGRFQWAEGTLVRRRHAARRPVVLSLGILATAATVIIPAAIRTPPAVAAECTTTWTGPAEGFWHTAGNWSTGKVPSSTDVACIGSGKTAKVTTSGNKVSIVQGEGTLRLEGGGLELARPASEGVSAIASLSMFSGSLFGVGELDVNNTLNWSGGGTMLGSGRTVLGPGATGSVSSSYLETRTFVNEGTLTIGSSSLSMGSGAKLENKGTLAVNAEAALAAIRKGTGAVARILNTGTIGKTAGTGESIIQVTVENFGTIDGGSGKLLLQGETAKLESGSVLEGFVRIQGPPAVGKNFTAMGTLEVGASLEIPGGYVGNVANFRLVGTLKGAGELNVTNSLYVGPTWTMRGTGTTRVAPGATGSINSMWLEERTLINEGSISLSPNTLNMGFGAKIENTGTFTANTEAAFDINQIGGAAPTFINTGVFQKTAGTGTTEVDVPFTNYGAIREASGHLLFTKPTKVAAANQFGKRCHSGDPVECATGNYAETQTDLAIGGLGVGLDLTRSYSAQAAATASSPGAFGYGWANSFSDRLVSEESGKKVTLFTASGSAVPFTGGPGTFTAPAWSQDSLSGNAEAGYTLILPEGIKYAFNGSGRLESVSDRNGNKTTLSYNKSGQLEKVIDPAGRAITLTYNGEGLIEKAEDPMGHLVKYTYESKNLKTVTLPGEASPRWQFKCDASHRITSVTDGRGGKTTNEYDGSSRVKSQTDPAGRTLAFEYAPFHTKITNKVTGSVTDQRFTSNNEPFSITRGYGTAAASTETFSYDSGGRLISAADGNGHTTTYGYNGQGDRTSEKDAEGDEIKWSFNAAHELVSMTTPRGETTTIERDAKGNVEEVSRPGPEETTQTTSFEHEENGQLESVTDPLERTWTYDYDVYGNSTSETDPLGNTQTLGYDKDSRLTSIVTPRGAEGAEATEFTTMIERDPLGHPLKAIDPLGHSVEYAYDGNGNLEAKADPNGHTTKYAYNADNEPIKVEKANGAVLKTEYDGEGNVISQTDANERTTTYVRNALGRPSEVIDPLGRKTLEEFDAAGNLKALVDSAERETSYAYDKADRLVGIDYSDPGTPDAEFEYDPDGNVTKMVDGTGESSFAYDQLGRLAEAEDGHGDFIGYGYDLAEELTGIAYPNGKDVSRTFDEAGRLESVTDWLGGTTTFAYDPNANLEAIALPLTSGNTDEYAYDNADRMSAAKFTSGPETLASLSYPRDKAGQIEEEGSAGLPGSESISYGYDENERLVEASEASFEYDPADNLTKAPGTTNAYDAASQLETGTGVSYAYDKLGERTKMTPEIGPATTYEYDQTGSLTSIERPEEGEGPAIEESLAYDAAGLLASKTSGLTTQYFAWDNTGSLPLLLSDDQSSYIYGPNDLPIEQISGEEEPTYLHHDQLGSTRMLTDATGEEVGAFSYGPFGSLDASTGTATTPMGFAGQYSDPETGLQYLRARFYDPATAQFLTRDPLAAVTRSLYGYGADNPLRNVDPSGMSCVNTADVGPFPVPTSVSPVDCVTEGVGTAAGAGSDALGFTIDHASLVIAPIVFLACVYEPEICTKAAVVGIAGTSAANGARALKEPCFDPVSASLRDLFVTLAAALPGGVFETTAGRAGPELTPLVRRILQIILDAPGLGLDLVNGAKSP